MRTLWRTLIIPHIDYCSQLYMPVTKSAIQSLEKLQKNFLNKIPALRHLDYWEKLNKLNLPSIERRLERYRVIYVWKVLQNLVPNCGINISHETNSRRGRKVEVAPILKNSTSTIKALRAQSFHHHGTKLFNIMPKHIRNCTEGMEDFKMQKPVRQIYKDSSQTGTKSNCGDLSLTISIYYQHQI